MVLECGIKGKTMGINKINIIKGQTPQTKIKSPSPSPNNTFNQLTPNQHSLYEQRPIVIIASAFCPPRPPIPHVELIVQKERDDSAHSSNSRVCDSRNNIFLVQLSLEKTSIHAAMVKQLMILESHQCKSLDARRSHAVVR